MPEIQSRTLGLIITCGRWSHSVTAAIFVNNTHGNGQILNRQPHPKICPNCHPGSKSFAWFCPNWFSLFWPWFSDFRLLYFRCLKMDQSTRNVAILLPKKNWPHPLTKSTSQPPGLWYFGQLCPNSRSRLPNPISHQAFFQNFAKCVRIGIHPLIRGPRIRSELREIGPLFKITSMLAQDSSESIQRYKCWKFPMRPRIIVFDSMWIQRGDPDLMICNFALADRFLSHHTASVNTSWHNPLGT